MVAGLGQPPFRAIQLSRHFFGRYTDRPEEMSDLPLAAREPLTQALLPRLLTPERELACDGGTTRKTLWRTFDGALVESVLMRYPERVTMCVSSQAGCGMACPFCATGQAGLTRNLSTAEIVAQVVAGARMLADGQVPGVAPRGGQGGSSPRANTARVSNVVFMGMGEPLANYASVLAAVRRLPNNSRSPWPYPCTPRTTNCVTRWCRSTGAGRSPRCSTPPGATPRPPAAASRSSTP